MAVFLTVAPFEATTVLAWPAVLVGTSVDLTSSALASLLVVLVAVLPLTGRRAMGFGSVPSALLNRRAWEARVRQARRGRRSFTIAVVDLDRFKDYNDWADVLGRLRPGEAR
jgi:hypothetical protein